jgi:hypothetical protein
LRKTEGIYFPEIKEPAFLAESTDFDLYANSKERYLSLYKKVKNEKVIGDASTYYLYDPSSPKLIEGLAGKDANIIILLRNPIDMAYSLWKHRVRESQEDLPFEEALSSWDERINNEDFIQKSEEWIYNFNYLGRAKYFQQVKRYIDRFDNTFVIIFEEFIKNTEEEYYNVCKFLDIEPNQGINFRAHNKSGEYKEGFLFKLFLKENFLKRRLKFLFPYSKRMVLVSRVKEFIKIERDYGEVSRNIRKELIEILKADVQKLNNLLGNDLQNHWPEYFE